MGVDIAGQDSQATKRLEEEKAKKKFEKQKAELEKRTAKKAVEEAAQLKATGETARKKAEAETQVVQRALAAEQAKAAEQAQALQHVLAAAQAKADEQAKAVQLAQAAVGDQAKLAEAARAAAAQQAKQAIATKEAEEAARQVAPPAEAGPMEQEQVEDDEEPSSVEITMDTSGLEPPYPEPSFLPLALSKAESSMCTHHRSVEDDESAWTLYALQYLDGMILSNNKKHDQGMEVRPVGDCFPRLWQYFELKGLISPAEAHNRVLDPANPLSIRITTTYQNYQAKHSEGEMVEVIEGPDWLNKEPVWAPPNIHYKQMLAMVLHHSGYSEFQTLEDNVYLISQTDSDKDVEDKAKRLLELCRACRDTPNEKLTDQTKEQLFTYGFRTMNMRQKLTKYMTICDGRNRTALIHILEEATAKLALEQLARTGYYTIKSGEPVDSAIWELRGVIQELRKTSSRDAELIKTLQRIQEGAHQNREDLSNGFFIDKQLDRRLEKESRRVTAITKQVEMRTHLPDLNDEDKKSQISAVEQYRQDTGEWYGIYDHLPPSIWSGRMSVEEHHRYTSLFEQVEPYVVILRRWYRAIYPKDLGALEMCSALIFWNTFPTLQALYFFIRWAYPFDYVDWKSFQQALRAIKPPCMILDYWDMGEGFPDENTLPEAPEREFTESSRFTPPQERVTGNQNPMTLLNTWIR